MLCLLFTVTACSSKNEETSKEDEIEAFIEAEDGYNYSIHNAVDRYGSICLEITQDYPDEDDISFIHYIDKNYAFYYRSDDDYDVLYNSKVYKKYLNNDEMIYGLSTDYKDDSEMEKTEFINSGFDFASEEDYDKSLVKHEDGTYTWTSSYSFTKEGTNLSYATAVIELNENYEITYSEITYYNDDDTVYFKEIVKYTSGVVNTDILEDLTNKINAAEGKTRHINFYEVKDGNSEKAWEVELPVGIALLVTFPDEYYNDGKVTLYTDATLTTINTKVDLYNDGDYYLAVK